MLFGKRERERAKEPKTIIYNIKIFTSDNDLPQT